MKGKWNKKMRRTAPGPGAYMETDRLTTSHAPTWKMGKEARFRGGETSRSKGEVPGPGKEAFKIQIDDL